MLEESMTDKDFLLMNADRQSSLIEGHCMMIESRLKSAPSRLEAERIAARECEQFDKGCPSTLMQRALSKHVNQIIERYWSEPSLRD